MTRRTLRAQGPADLLALVPLLFGFHPEDSVVLMSVGEATHPFHARSDLPRDPADLADLADLAHYLASVAARNGAQRVAVLVYSDRAAPARAFAAGAEAACAEAGLTLVCAVRADGARWWLLDGSGERDGPGTPYDLSTHPFTAQGVLDGTVVLGSRGELADSLVGTDAAETQRIGLLADDASARLVRAPDDGRWVRGRVRRFLDDGRPLDAADAARLAVAITVSLDLRDVAWVEMRRDNARQHVELWRDLTRRVPEEVRAAPAALLAFAAWLAGHGALAWGAVDRAQQADPGYGLAALVAQALAGAVPPTAWTPPPARDLPLLHGPPELGTDGCSA